MSRISDEELIAQLKNLVSQSGMDAQNTFSLLVEELIHRLAENDQAMGHHSIIFIANHKDESAGVMETLNLDYFMIEQATGQHAHNWPKQAKKSIEVRNPLTGQVKKADLEVAQTEDHVSLTVKVARDPHRH